MSFKQAIIQNTTWRFAGLVFVFANNILIARLLGVEQTGQFFYAISFFTLIVTCLRLGVENGIVYLSSKYENATGTLFYLILPLVVVQTGIIFLLLKYSNFFQPVYNLTAAVVFISGNVALYYITAFYHGKKEFFTINIINTALNIVQTIFLAVLFFCGKNILNRKVGYAAADAVLWMMTLAVAIQVISMAIHFRFRYQQYFEKIKISVPLIKGLFAYSGLTFISSILLFLVSRADFYFVEKYCDAHALGNYVQAAKIGQMALILPGLLGGVVFPFSIGAADAFAEKIAFLCRMLTLFFLVLFIMVFATGYYVLPWLLGREFDTVFTIILLILPGIYFMSIGLIILSFLEGKNKQVVILFSNLVVLALIVTADLYFVPQYKYTAAAVIFSLSNLAGVAILLNYFLKHTSVKTKSLFAFSINDIKKLR